MNMFASTLFGKRDDKIANSKQTLEKYKNLGIANVAGLGSLKVFFVFEQLRYRCVAIYPSDGT